MCIGKECVCGCGGGGSGCGSGRIYVLEGRDGVRTCQDMRVHDLSFTLAKSA